MTRKLAHFCSWELPPPEREDTAPNLPFMLQDSWDWPEGIASYEAPEETIVRNGRYALKMAEGNLNGNIEFVGSCLGSAGASFTSALGGVIYYYVPFAFNGVNGLTGNTGDVYVFAKFTNMWDHSDYSNKYFTLGVNVTGYSGGGAATTYAVELGEFSGSTYTSLAKSTNISVGTTWHTAIVGLKHATHQAKVWVDGGSPKIDLTPSGTFDKVNAYLPWNEFVKEGDDKDPGGDQGAQLYADDWAIFHVSSSTIGDELPGVGFKGFLYQPNADVAGSVEWAGSDYDTPVAYRNVDRIANDCSPIADATLTPAASEKTYHEYADEGGANPNAAIRLCWEEGIQTASTHTPKATADGSTPAAFGEGGGTVIPGGHYNNPSQTYAWYGLHDHLTPENAAWNVTKFNAFEGGLESAASGDGSTQAIGELYLLAYGNLITQPDDTPCPPTSLVIPRPRMAHLIGR